jgi:predicted ATPase
MDLKEFVSETLRQIVDGINDAQQLTPPKGAVIVPYYEKLEKVEFDVAVTVIEGTETSGKAGISVWSIGAGVSGKSESSTSTLSRIRFSVAVELPKGNQEPPRQMRANTDYNPLDF